MFKYLIITIIGLCLFVACDSKISGTSNQISTGKVRCSNPHVEKGAVLECGHDQNDVDGAPCIKTIIIQTKYETASCVFDASAPEGTGRCDITIDPEGKTAAIQEAWYSPCESVDKVTFIALLNIFAGCKTGQCDYLEHESSLVACLTESAIPNYESFYGPVERGDKYVVGCN